MKDKKKTLTKNQRWSQLNKLHGANALVFDAIDNLVLNENSSDMDISDVAISDIVESLDTASHILKEVQKFLES